MSRQIDHPPHLCSNLSAASAALNIQENEMPAALIEPTQIDTFHLMGLKASIQLEAKGMRHSSGRSATAIARTKLGLDRSASREEIIEALDALIQERTA